MVKLCYHGIFQPKQHFIVVRDRKTNKGKKKYIFNDKTIDKIIKHQKDYEDIFVSKYAKNGVVSCIIWDFDSDTRSEAYDEIAICKEKLDNLGFNCIIVDSTNKGYHLYIQMQPLPFDDESFNEFQNLLLNKININLKTLDKVNYNAGLGGNIRCINSIHPSTLKKVSIIDGEFIDYNYPNQTAYELRITAEKKQFSSKVSTMSLDERKELYKQIQ
jgi:hypothetical protein